MSLLARALIVDDDPITRALLLRALSQKNFVCDAVSEGNAALEKIVCSYRENRRYHLIILDIMLPNLDGLVLLESLRSLEEAGTAEPVQRPKVIMLSSLDDELTVLKAFHLGCEGYLIKPFSSAALSLEVDRLGHPTLAN